MTCLVKELLGMESFQKSKHIGMSEPTSGYEAWITFECLWLAVLGEVGTLGPC